MNTNKAKFKIGDEVISNFFNGSRTITGINRNYMQIYYYLEFDDFEWNEEHLEHYTPSLAQRPMIRPVEPKKMNTLLPTEVTFNYENGKTTLMFNNVKLGHHTTSKNNDGWFNLYIGFYIAFLKEIEKDNSKKFIDWLYHVGLTGVDLERHLKTLVSTALLKFDILSWTQLTKLIEWDFTNDLTLTLKDNTTHVITVRTKEPKEIKKIPF